MDNNKDNQNAIVVTILCTAYNHEKYIRDCLEGIVNQKTDFRYECIVHDDASTDNTAKIIKEYYNLYPEIIVPIYQKENKYSKGIDIIKSFMIPQCQGKYIAFCEGDDFWVEKNKLQKQVDALEANPDAAMCVCAVNCVSEEGELIDKTIPRVAIEPGVIYPNEFIPLIHSEYTFQTSGYVVRSNYYIKFNTNEPKFKKVARVGDWPMLFYFGSLFPVIYIDDKMSCYRELSEDSFTSRMNKDYEYMLNFHWDMIKMIEEFNLFSEKRYQKECDAFSDRYKRYAYYVLIENRKYKTILKKEYRKCFMTENMKNKLFLIWNCIKENIKSI